MRSAEFAMHSPVLTRAKHVRADASSLEESETIGQLPSGVPGLAQDIDRENYITDLEDLAHLILRYIDLRDRVDTEDDPDLMTLLQRITTDIKNIAVIYTDCLNEALTHFKQTQQDVKSQLQAYPEAIAQLQRKLLKVDQRIRQLSESVTILMAAIERQIAFDAALKNDSQRKARRVELMESDSDYISATIALKAAQDRRESLLIELQLLRNQFSVLKLDLREAIANKELAAYDAA